MTCTRCCWRWEPWRYHVNVSQWAVVMSHLCVFLSQGVRIVRTPSPTSAQQQNYSKKIERLVLLRHTFCYVHVHLHQAVVMCHLEGSGNVQCYWWDDCLASITEGETVATILNNLSYWTGDAATIPLLRDMNSVTWTLLSADHILRLINANKPDQHDVHERSQLRPHHMQLVYRLHLNQLQQKHTCITKSSALLPSTFQAITHLVLELE